MKIESSVDFCLLIPCYNNYDGLIQSLKTVNYPIAQFRIVIVDDGSLKKVTLANIENDLGLPLPLVVLTMEKNSGITSALNHGLHWIVDNIDCSYVARLDCGDTCDPGRFHVQVESMKSNEQLDLIGSWCRFQDNEGNGFTYETPTTHEEIEKGMYFRNLFIHPTVMYRLSAVKKVGYYPEGFDYAEDYALFWMLMAQGQTMVINKILVTCEINKSGISFVNKSKQLGARWRVVKRYGSSWWLKAAGFIRLSILFILPKRLTLLLKKGKG